MMMKKVLMLLLALAMVCALASCGGKDTETEESKAENSYVTSEEEESSETDTTVSVAESSEPEESSDPEAFPEFGKNFLSIGTVDVKVNANSANAIRLTGVNVPYEPGAVVLYTPAYDEPLDLNDSVIAVFTYDQSVFGYVKSDCYELGADWEADLIPSDGFIVVADSRQKTCVDKLKGIKEGETVFPHGVHLTELDYTVKKATSAPQIDGVFVKSEWENYRIDEVNSENDLWSYAQFEENTYYATATYYAAYDANYLYLCVVVSSPYHYCPITPESAGDMWQYECIQVKVCSEAPDGEYISENFDHVANNKAISEGIVRNYGFAANDKNETCFYESGIQTKFTGKAACSRNDQKQQTVYEVAIPWSEYQLKPETGMRLGLTFSINSTNADDIAKGLWKNITYRCGGGVIGRNDWSKIPVITLN